MNFDKMDHYEEFYDKMMESVGAIDEDVKARMSGYRERKVLELVDQLLSLNRRNEEHELLGLIHGDCWINNIMIREFKKSDKDDDSCQQKQKEGKSFSV